MRSSSSERVEQYFLRFTGASSIFAACLSLAPMPQTLCDPFYPTLLSINGRRIRICFPIHAILSADCSVCYHYFDTMPCFVHELAAFLRTCDVSIQDMFKLIFWLSLSKQSPKIYLFRCSACGWERELKDIESRTCGAIVPPCEDVI